MKCVGTTLNDTQNFCKVYECEFCGKRSRDKEVISRCEISCHHKEEASTGDL